MWKDIWRIGVDTGGTFTDFLLADDRGRILSYKLPSTPDDPAKAVLQGLDVLLERLDLEARTERVPQESLADGLARRKVRVVHGSTVATNALLEGAMSDVAWVGTAGFEDILWLGRQERPALYALYPEKPAPTLSRERCLGVEERIGSDGQILRTLTVQEIERIVRQLGEWNVEAVVLCLLHSYTNSAHEQALAAAIRAALPDVHLTVSHELLPEFREFERASTCLMNGLVAPPMTRYLRHLCDDVGESSLRIMASVGGDMPPAVIEKAPAHTVLSGPAGGVLGALQTARLVREERIIGFDMGGTSTDVSLCEGELRRTTEGTICGWPIRLPMLDVETVGAGGGSIAWLDAGGALQVGPQSAGARPGPACYGFQSPPYQATVTDAHLVLGHLSTEEPLAGSLVLQKEPAVAAISALAEAASMSMEAMALGILRVAEAKMMRAIQRISMQKGYDPRRFALLPFGGAGGLHACRLAELLGIQRVILPAFPGMLSALGMLCAAPVYSFSQSTMLTFPADDAGNYPDITCSSELSSLLHTLEMRAHSALQNESSVPSHLHVQTWVDMRYAGQSYELTIPLVPKQTSALFAKKHQALYGYTCEGAALEVINVRFSIALEEPSLVLPGLISSQSGVAPVPRSHGDVFDGQKWRSVPRYHRGDLFAGDRLQGPCLLQEYSATTWIAEGWQMEVDVSGICALNICEKAAERA